MHLIYCYERVIQAYPLPACFLRKKAIDLVAKSQDSAQFYGRQKEKLIQFLEWKN